MEKIKLIIGSQVPHISQIITGFLMLKDRGYQLEFEYIPNDGSTLAIMPAIRAEYRGQHLMYDVGDGYNVPESIVAGAEISDFYFKRSFSAERNREIVPQYLDKMYPLGFNYHVTCKGNPVGEPLWKTLAKPFFGKTPDCWFKPHVFEGKARENTGAPAKILFLTRLWDDHEPTFSAEQNAERTYINTMRIEIIRALRKTYGDAFVGGLNDNELSRAWAPDLIMPAKYTERRRYLKLLHSSDICIGSMGLFESIGWKTGEYVAAAKAIVNEEMHFTVTGDFEEGKNYLSFRTAEECLEAVRSLTEDPLRLYEMKLANERYYQQYLRPDVLVKRTLDIVDRVLENKKIKN